MITRCCSTKQATNSNKESILHGEPVTDGRREDFMYMGNLRDHSKALSISNIVKQHISK